MHIKRPIISALICAAALLLSAVPSSAAEVSDASVLLNGRKIRFSSPVMVEDGASLAEVRPLAEALGASVKWNSNTQSVKLSTKKTAVVLKTDYDIMTQTDLYETEEDSYEQLALSASPRLIDDVLYVPVRDVAEAFGAELEWDGDSCEIRLSTGNYSYSRVRERANPAGDYKDGSDHTFYFQNQADWQLPGFGSGYCWTCSYAMLISDVTGTLVTPNDVAAVNEDKSGSGAYCHHWDIADEFGLRFVSALPEDSQFYGGRDSNSGGTLLLNDGDDDLTREALREALDLHPEGVMVRYASYPHTMVAVGYDSDYVYFNEPMQLGREYMDESGKRNVTFDETCIGRRGISLSEITFIQALEEK